MEASGGFVCKGMEKGGGVERVQGRIHKKRKTKGVRCERPFSHLQHKLVRPHRYRAYQHVVQLLVVVRTGCRPHVDDPPLQI